MLVLLSDEWWQWASVRCQVTGKSPSLPIKGNGYPQTLFFLSPAINLPFKNHINRYLEVVLTSCLRTGRDYKYNLIFFLPFSPLRKRPSEVGRERNRVLLPKQIFSAELLLPSARSPFLLQGCESSKALWLTQVTKSFQSQSGGRSLALLTHRRKAKGKTTKAMHSPRAGAIS